MKHKDNENYRLSFLKDVSTLYERIPCNPFEKDQLIPLNNSDDPYEISIIENLKNMLSTGENQVKVFIVNRLILQKVSISETIRKNNFPLLKSQHSCGGRNDWNFGVARMNKLHSCY